jgi:hypothetical protein
MTTPTHVAADLGAFIVLTHIGTLDPNYVDLAILLGSNLIDLDHLFSRPIYHPRRNPFKTHPLHRQWIAISLASVLMLFVRPLSFLGVGLMLHFFLDYLYIRRERI